MTDFLLGAITGGCIGLTVAVSAVRWGREQFLAGRLRGQRDAMNVVNRRLQDSTDYIERMGA